MDRKGICEAGCGEVSAGHQFREYAENQTLIEQKGLTLIEVYERQTFFTVIEQSQ